MNKHKHTHLRVSDVVRNELKDELNSQFTSLIEQMLVMDVQHIHHLPTHIMREMNDVLNQIHKCYSKQCYKEYAKAYKSLIDPIRYKCGYEPTGRV